MVTSDALVPWFTDYVNYIVGGVLPPECTSYRKKKFLSDARHFYWDEPNL